MKHSELGVNREKKKCPECSRDMKKIEKQGYSIPTSFDKEKKSLTWSSCSANLMEYIYWECVGCGCIVVED